MYAVIRNVSRCFDVFKCDFNAISTNPGNNASSCKCGLHTFVIYTILHNSHLARAVLLETNRLYVFYALFIRLFISAVHAWTHDVLLFHAPHSPFVMTFMSDVILTIPSVMLLTIIKELLSIAITCLKFNFRNFFCLCFIIFF